MAALSSGHLATDFANGALPALLPFFVDKFALSYTLAAAVILASAVSSSIVQPLFGLWSDRRGAIWLLPAGVALAGIGIALAAVAPSYWLVLVFVVVSGFGVAAFHPEGSKFAAFAGGRRRASAMSLFSIGGNLGFALGPTVATPLVLAFGLTGGLLLSVPCLAVALGLLMLAPFLGSFAPDRRRQLQSEEPDRLGALLLLLGVIAFRSVAWFGLIALAGVGISVIATFGVTMVMSQEYLPRHIGMASGLSIGLSIGLGGVGAVALGAVADSIDLRAAMYAAAGAAAAALVLAVRLPSSRPSRRLAVEPVAP
jgi:FSR family fosmidomycin resistance protein-like MFS transporter